MAYGKMKMGKEKDLTDPKSLGKGGGRVYTGGTPDFDESAGIPQEGYGKPRRIGGGQGSLAGKPGRTPVPPMPKPLPGMGIGKPTTPGIDRPTPIDMVGRRKRPTRLGQKPGLRTIQPVNPRRGMGY